MLSFTKIAFLLLIFLLSQAFIGRSQESFPPQLESIAMQTDRTTYLSGEEILFAANYRSDSSCPNLSKVLYLELFNNDLKVIATQKIDIQHNHLISGSMHLPPECKTGYYLLRAYTRYQQNFPVWEMETLILKIINPQHPLSAPPKSNQNQIAKWVPISNNYIGFMIQAPYNKQVDTLFLSNPDQPLHSTITYYPNGLGKIKLHNKELKETELSIVLTSGDTLTTYTPSKTNTNNLPVCNVVNHNLVIQLTQCQQKEGIVQVLIRNLTHGISLQEQTYLNNHKGILRVPIANTGHGLIGITIQETAQPEVTVFHYIPTKKAQAFYAPSNKTVHPNDLLELDLSSINSNQYPLTIACVLSQNKPDTSLLLPQYILDNPIYIDSYLSEIDFPTKELKDQTLLLLAIQQSILKEDSNLEKQKLVLPDYYGLTLDGQLHPVDKTLNNTLMYCSVLGNNPQFHATKIAQNGSFSFTLNPALDIQDIYIGSSNQMLPEQKIGIERGFCKTPPRWHKSHYAPDTNDRRHLEQLFFNQQINDIFPSAKSSIDSISISNRPVFGEPSNSILLSDFVQLSTTQEVFNELVPYVKARKKNEEYNFVVLDEILQVEYEDPLVLVDQVPYNNINEIMKLQPTEIEQIEVFSRIYAYGDQLFNGIIMITTSQGNLAGLPLPPGSIFVEYQTLSSVSKKACLNGTSTVLNLPHYYNVLYWKLLKEPPNSKILLHAPASIGTYEINYTHIEAEKTKVGQQIIRVKDIRLDK